jgi:hypothetical protein
MWFPESGQFALCGGRRQSWYVLRATNNLRLHKESRRDDPGDFTS